MREYQMGHEFVVSTIRFISIILLGRAHTEKRMILLNMDLQGIRVTS